MATPTEIRQLAAIIHENFDQVINCGDMSVVWVGGLISGIAGLETDDQITERLASQDFSIDMMIERFKTQLPDLFPRD